MSHPQRESWKESEGELFRLLVENSRDYAIFVMDSQRRVQSWNPGAERLLGYREDEILGHSADIFFTSEDRASGIPQREMQAALEAGAGADDRWHVRKDGSRFWAGGIMTPLREESGEIRGFAKIMRDRTEWKLRADAAQEQARLAAFNRDVGLALTQSSSLPDMLAHCAEAMVCHLDGAFVRIWTLDSDGSALELRASAGMYTHLDGPHSRIPLGQHNIGRIARERKPHLTNAVIGDPRISDQQWARQQGMVAFAGYPLIVDDRVVGVMAMFARQPLTRTTLEAMASVANGIAVGIERKTAEEERRAQQEWLSITLASIGDAVIATDTQGRVAFLNGVAQELTGWTQQDAQGRPLEAVFRILSEQTRQAVENPVEKVLRQGVIVGLANHTVLVAKDGTERPIDDSAAPIRDASGKLVGVVLIFRDVTEQRRAEAALQERERELRLVTDHAPTLLAHCDREGRYKFVNRAYAERFDLTPQDLIGKRIPEVVGEQAFAQFRQYIDAALAGKSVEFEVEIPYERIGRRVMHCAYAPEFDGSGQVQGLIAVITDVTQRKRTEDALRESHERLDLALQAADMGQWELSLADQRAKRNLRHDQIFGYDSLLPEWTYEMFLDHVVLEDRAAVDANFRQAASSHEPWDFECRIRRADGAERWIWARGRVFEEGNGQALRMAGTVADITDRKRIEEELREARSLLDAALEAGTIAAWTWDIPNNRLFTDEKLARLFNLPPSDAEGGLLDRYIKAIHPEDWPRVSAALSHSVESGQDYEADYRIVQPDGSVRWVVARGRAERDGMGRAVRMPGVLVDITERKRLEEELRLRVDQLAAADRRKEELLASLRESEEKLRLLADTIPQLAWMATPEGDVIWYNRRWYEYTGTTPEDVQGWGWQVVHDPDVLPRVLERWNTSIAMGEPFDMVFPLKGADGSFRPFLTRVNPLRDGAGRILYWFGTNTDISEIKRMEEALRDADRRKDEFLATLAHELRNPLAPIRNSLQILKMSRVDADTARQTREIMERQVHHLVRLVDDLLDVSRVMRGKIELRHEPVELATVVARAVETAKPLIEVQGHTLDISLPTDSLLLDADPVRLTQVIGNLLTNSAKYTEANGHIWLTAQRIGGEAVLRVRDDGIGISPDMLPHVFELFVQVDHSSTKAQGGLGIGLTLVKNLVEMHGGTVEAHSAGLGQGCEFVIRLPLLVQEQEEPIDEANGEPQQPAAGAFDHRLMVVDDNRDAAMSLAMLLQLQGYEVRVIHDGASALELARTYRPALIFLDIGMPGMDGLEVARRIRQTPGLEKTVLAALTGWGQQEDRQRTAEAGFHHHLVKPPEPKAVEDLLSALKKR